MPFNDDVLTRQQEEWVRTMLRPEADHAALLALDMGLGKTRTGMMFARALGKRCVLIVVPLQTVDAWMETAREECPHLRVRQIDSTDTGKEALEKFQWRASGVYIVGHEYWERLAWKKVPVKKKRKTEPGTIGDKQEFRKVDSGCWGGPGYLLIYDESHRSANTESWTHRALMNIDPQVFKLSMSGTFMGDRFDGAYGATRWLWPHRTDIIPANIFDWRAMWAEVKYDRWAPRNQKTVGEKVDGAFVSALPCYIRVESSLPEPIPLDVWVDLGEEQRRVYDELDDMMVAWIEDHPLVTEYAITKIARQRQVTLAYPELTFSEDDPTELIDVSFNDDAASAKADAFIADIEGHGLLPEKYKNLLVGEQLLILTDSQKFARLLTNRLNERFGDVAREWSGKTTHPNRKIIKQQFIDGEVQYLVGVQAAMGTGTDGLQAASHIVVSMSLATRRINNDQGVSRLNRKGQDQQVYYVRYLAKDTLDSGQLSAQMQAALAANRQMKAKARLEARQRGN